MAAVALSCQHGAPGRSERVTPKAMSRVEVFDTTALVANASETPDEPVEGMSLAWEASIALTEPCWAIDIIWVGRMKDAEAAAKFLDPLRVSPLLRMGELESISDDQDALQLSTRYTVTV